MALLAGCSRMPLLYLKGPIGEAERLVILASFGLMPIVVIPVFVMLFWFSVKYRAFNAKVNYMPKWSRSKKIESVMWLSPAGIVAAMGILTWTATDRLDPFKPIAAAAEPIRHMSPDGNGPQRSDFPSAFFPWWAPMAVMWLAA
jgi:cytochrome o ubiquinol oxidase subunit 2